MRSIILLALSVFTFNSCSESETKSTQTTSTAIADVKQATKARHVKSDKAKELLSENSDVVVLDVRTPAEFSEGHLQKAVNLDYNAPGFTEQLNKLDPTKKYLVYCAAGGRSAKAVALMEEKGFAQVYNCEEGFTDLKKTGVPTE